MTVQTLLAVKGTIVYTIEPTTSVACAAKVLSSHAIGALVVTDPKGSIVGIISERDIVRVLSALGCAALDTPVGEVMTRKVMTCNLHDRIDHIMHCMTEGRLRHFPVVEGERLIGVVSIRDIVEQRLREMKQDSEALREYADSKSQARQHQLQHDAHMAQARFPRVF